MPMTFFGYWSVKISKRTSCFRCRTQSAGTMKIQRLLLAGSNIDQLVDGVRLLIYIVWDTFANEFGHGSSAFVHRSHADISAQELSTRSPLQQPWFCFSMNPHDIRIAGRHALRRECFHGAAGATNEQMARRKTINHLMRVHGSWYDSLPPNAHFHYDEMADAAVRKMARHPGRESQH